MQDTPMITPVLLCGGSGTRLWPLSRKSYPKQFAQLIDQDSLFQASARRFSGNGFAPPMVLTNSDFRFIVTEQLAEAGVDPGPILIEPQGRNTAPALLAAALMAAQEDPDTLMLAAPSDHLIPDSSLFRQAIQQGIAVAQKGQIVTFGIRPDRAETGYGYLELGNTDGTQAIPLKRFIEKPNAAQAAVMVRDDSYLWNAGIFLYTAQTLIQTFEQHAPDILRPVQQAIELARSDLGFLRLHEQSWAQTPDISVDYAVMEKCTDLCVIPYDGQWNDLGDWRAIWRAQKTDADGVATVGNATALDCRNSLLHAQGDGIELVGLGLENIVAIAMPDAVLVAHKNHAQDVGAVVKTLKQADAPQATQFPKDHRPWGWAESIALGDRFQVKRIVVHPGASLSLQSHLHRAEHWIVVEGTAEVTIDDKVQLVSENQSVYIPLGAVHRLTNPGKLPMALIEVQTGAYLAEDDIQRYEDLYARD